LTRLPQERSFELVASDGIRIHALLAAPAKPTAVLLLCHGLTTNCDEHGTFVALRDRALRSGLAVARFDFRGHGASGGSNEGLRLAGLRADVEAVLALIDAEIGAEVPIVPVGLSFGGGAAIHAAAVRKPCTALALWYPVIDYEWNYGPGSTVPFTARMHAARDARVDPAWSAMPLLGTDWHFPAALLDEIREDRTSETLSSLTVPVRAYHGSRDTFVDSTPIRRLAATHPNIDLRIAYGAGHGFLLWRPWVVRATNAFALLAGRAAARRATHTGD
jgi:pimeloyl-ACP methyl ester carboxylesterase